MMQNFQNQDGTKTMASTCEIIDPTEYASFDELLLGSARPHFFLSSVWADVFKSAYRYQPYYWMSTQNRELRFLLPMMEVNSFLTGKRAISLPFTDYCEPICENEAQFEAVMEEIHAFAEKRRWQTIEFRGGEAFLAKYPAARSYFTHQLSLSAEPKQVFAQFQDSTRRNIRKAEREGVRVELTTTPESLKAFYRLNGLTRKKHGLPPQPLSFFRALYDKIILPGKGKIFLAKVGEQIIAGAVFIEFGDQIIYKYGASDERYQALRANNLIMWKAIEYGCLQGYKNFDFGKTEPGNEGLRRYKLGWAAQETLIHYHKYHIAKQRFIIESAKEHHWSTRIFSGMPTILLKVLGHLLYAHAA
jgi:CelD/BcsL family acetyltransferase involved in cellulose biosynthesis